MSPEGLCHSPPVSGLSRDEFESLWDRLDAEALAIKQSQEATVRSALSTAS